MDLSKYVDCPSYEKLVKAHVAFQRAFSMGAQSIGEMHNEREAALKQCKLELSPDYKGPSETLVVGLRLANGELVEG
jgi:hypothetical protein